MKLMDKISSYYQQAAGNAFLMGEYVLTQFYVLAMEAVDYDLVEEHELAIYAEAMDRGQREMSIILTWLFANRRLRATGARFGFAFPQP